VGSTYETVTEGLEACTVALADVTHFGEGLVSGVIFSTRFGGGAGGGFCKAAGVAGGVDCGNCEGRHEGLSQHKAVSIRSWDSGVEHPEANKRAKIIQPKIEK